MDWKTNDAGFTLLETLLILSIIAITLPFSVYLLQSIQSAPDHENVSVQQFFAYLRNDALVTDNIHHDYNRLYFEVNKFETASIERYRNIIRRRITGGRGHEVYLQDVADFHVEPVSFGFRVTVTTLKGETYEKTIATYDDR